MQDIKYIQLEPAAFLTDVDFQMMTAEERGVYCSIIFYLYANKGVIQLSNNGVITELYQQKLAVISGCYKSGNEWESLWEKMKHKFIIDGNKLTHKRVTEELNRALEYKKQRSEAGKKGMQHRYNATITKESKVKESKGKNIYSQNSNELRLATLLFELIQSRKPDIKKPSLQKWAKNVDLMIRVDKRTPEKISNVIKWSQQDTFWQNNILSTDKLRKQFDKLELQMNQTKPGQPSHKISPERMKRIISET